MKIVNIEEENSHISWTIWGISMNFSDLVYDREEGMEEGRGKLTPKSYLG